MLTKCDLVNGPVIGIRNPLPSSRLGYRIWHSLRLTNACDTTSIFSKALFRLGILYQILNLQCGDKVPFTMKLFDVGLGTLYQVLVLSYCDNTPITIYLVDQVQVPIRWGTLYHISDLRCCDKTLFTEQMCSRRFIGSAFLFS